ncbi:hypothetical protein BKI52_08240 [marine bacterium AO1-C]|nr:hypothetical protein BKI52_08240 [marine bacterium AO1-C]
MKNEFRALLERFAPIDELAWQEFASFIQLKTYQKDEMILPAGKTCNFIGFLYKGNTRVYEIVEGIEVNRVFFLEKNFVTEYYSFISQTPSKETIVCLDDCQILMINYEALQQLYAKHKSMERVGRCITEYMYIRQRNKVTNFLINNPEERYLYLLKENPQLLEKVPHYHIASFLGITPQSLSRIRKRLEHVSSPK